MKWAYIFIVFIISVQSLACTGTKEKSQPVSIKSADKQTVLDTIVRTIPVDYMSEFRNADASQKIAIIGYEGIFALFEKYNYTLETWQKGFREVPRLYINDISEEWGSQISKEITVSYKKRIFFRLVTPLILRANELILKDRDRLTNLFSKLSAGNTLSAPDSIWIHKLAKLYKFEFDEDEITLSQLNKLEERVDIIPASLALSQAAAESGWGTSGFAADGNALFGQWTWGQDAMIPDEQRKHLGNYGVAAFESLQESVSGYMLNLNRHYAYQELRDKRAQLRKNGEKLSGYVLAEGLLRYSEKGESYVKTLRTIMEFNKLKQVDDAYLADDAPVYLFRDSD